MVCFLSLFLSGLCLWKHWDLGLYREFWKQFHFNSGLCLVLAIGFHLYFNRRAMISYLKLQKRALLPLRMEWALIGALLIGLATISLIGPQWDLRGPGQRRKAAIQQAGLNESPSDPELENSPKRQRHGW